MYIFQVLCSGHCYYWLGIKNFSLQWKKNSWQIKRGYEFLQILLLPHTELHSKQKQNAPERKTVNKRVCMIE